MRAMRVVNILGLVLGLLVGSAAAQSVQSDFDRGFQFSNLKDVQLRDPKTRSNRSAGGRLVE